MADKIYTIENLRTWDRKAPSLAVIGKPIGHSLSPKMHNAAIEHLHCDSDGLRYFKFEIEPENLSEALVLFFSSNFVGLNLTIPHKVIVLPFLKKISTNALTIGAANTLYRDNSLGGFCGDNTDGNGFRIAAESTLNRKLSGAPLVLLGAGGAARAIAAVALASNCSNLTLINRSCEKAKSLAESLRQHFPNKRISLADKNFIPEENTLIVNATPLGLKPDDPPPFPPELLRSDMAVYDTTYGEHTSTLVAEAQKRNIPVADGRSMLAWQGALAFEIWTKIPAQAAFTCMQSAISKPKSDTK